VATYFNFLRWGKPDASNCDLALLGGSRAYHLILKLSVLLWSSGCTNAVTGMLFSVAMFCIHVSVTLSVPGKITTLAGLPEKGCFVNESM
jgi:hypothetical protein